MEIKAVKKINKLNGLTEIARTEFKFLVFSQFSSVRFQFKLKKMEIDWFGLSFSENNT